jgi:mannan endo-1,4-beta-mannosidase
VPLALSRRLRLAAAAALLVSLAGGFGGSALAAAADPNVISRSGSTLMLHGHAYRFTGVNAYELGTLWSVNAGCGTQLSDPQLDAFFGSLRADSVVRFWAFQSMGVNRATRALDFRGLDRVFRAAERHGQRLIPVLGEQAGVCDDGHWKDRSWYAGGYTKRFNDDKRGLNVVPYKTWVTAVVNRYKGSAALGMWEPVNEPEATNCTRGVIGAACYKNHPPCPVGAASALRSFFDAVGGQIKKLDPKHLVASGVMGSGQCGAQGAEYALVHASPGIDVATFHDYGKETTAVPAALTQRLQQAQALSKPLISEEVGVHSSPDHSSACPEPVVRASLMQQKLTSQLNAGSRGFLVWNYGPGAVAGCSYDVPSGDPTLTLLSTAPR